MRQHRHRRFVGSNSYDRLIRHRPKFQMLHKSFLLVLSTANSNRRLVQIQY
jgi:hypothetical protein